MNVSSIEKQDCCGCSACMAVCPKDSISMVSDDEGFLYPKVNTATCVNCGICISTCKAKGEKKYAVIETYAAKNNDMNVISKSSSGGLSHAICREIIEAGGVVYGISYYSNNEVIIERADTIDEADNFYGSKYVQANPLNSFRDARKILAENRKVLFISTSCYIAGLLSFLEATKTPINNLYTVDLICHGVPSPRIFKDYIKWIEEKKGAVDTFFFRTKKKPWGYGSRNFGCTIKYANGKEETDTVRSRVFLNLFFSNNCLRPHCHQCRFAGVDKPADLTVADYWGCKEEEPDFFTEKGVSAVIAHTQKGIELLANATELEMKKTTIDKIKKKQGNLDHSSPASETRDEFWKNYLTEGFYAIARKYGAYNIQGFMKNSRAYRLYADIRNRR